MKSPSEQQELGRKLLDSQLRQIDSIVFNLNILRKNPEFNHEGMRLLNTVQSDLIVLMQYYGESLFNLISQGYEID